MASHPLVDVIWNFFPFCFVIWEFPFRFFLNIIMFPLYFLTVLFSIFWNFLPMGLLVFVWDVAFVLLLIPQVLFGLVAWAWWVPIFGQIIGVWFM